MSFKFYTFSYNNPERKRKMKERFSKEDIDIEFVECVEQTDTRVSFIQPEHRRCWAVMWNHLDMLKLFIESDNEYGIFCEDDIEIRKGIKKYIPEIICAYNRLNLEILMLGYLIPFVPVDIKTTNMSLLDRPLSYLTYDNDVWGAQMYLLNRKTVTKFLERYTVDYAIKSLLDSSMQPFCSDWTLTKEGERAAIYPMMAVEEGVVATDHQGQIDFHRMCNLINRDDNYH